MTCPIRLLYTSGNYLSMNSNTKIGILGGGVEGAALAVYFSGKGFSDVCVYDEKGAVDCMLPPDVQVVSGVDSFEKIYDREVIFRSPGIHVDRLFEAHKRGITVTSAIRYFFDNCPCPIVGVTGTKGKGTTSTLIYEIFKEAGRDVYLGGNIGEPPVNFLDLLAAESTVVLELSSFQLQDLHRSPEAAVVLMTTMDHMDYHNDKQEYWDAKKQIMSFQGEKDFTVLNADYEYSDSFLEYGNGKKLMVSRKEKVADGAYVADGKVYLAGVKISDGLRESDVLVCGTDEVGLLGAHNLENVMAACVVAREFEIKNNVIRRAVKKFKGLPNRLEFVREIDGVRYYNDSFSTTPETSIAGACAFDSPVLLIAGGSEKHSDFSEWALALQQNDNVKIVYLIGDVAGKMDEALRDAEVRLNEMIKGGMGSDEAIEAGVGAFPVEIYRCDGLETALKKAKDMAVKGDNIVMSPGAASFGLFKNYKVRGETFRKIVGDL